MPQSAAQAGQAIAANPQNAAAILSQLTNNPANRSAPPAYWFMLMNQHVSNQPMHDATTLAHHDQVAKNPANQQANAAFDLMLSPGPGRATGYRDRARTRETSPGQPDSSKGWPWTFRFVEATNHGINQYNDRALPVLKAITGRIWASSPRNGRAGGPTSSAMPISRICPRPNPPTPTSLPWFPDGHTVRALPPAHWSKRSTARGRSNRSGLATGLVAGHLDREARVSARGGHPSQSAGPDARIAVGGESIVATGIHRFWKAGKGWTMARELKAGDRLRMVGGMVEIESIETDKTQPVYNLDVADNRDFFVGTKGLLVHDFSFVQPVLEPFDRQPNLAMPKSTSK